MTNSTSVEALLDGLRAEIARLPPGSRLPTSRELARRHKVGPVTVTKVFAQLAAEGLVTTQPGSGSYVAPRRPSRDGVPGDVSWQAVTLAGRGGAVHPGGPREGGSAPEADDAPAALPEGGVLMAGGYLHRALQPGKALGAALARAARRPDAWDRAPTSGLAPLRAIFAKLVGNGTTPEDVLVTGGGQGALSMLFRALAAPGGPVLVESPTYPGALAAARAAGLRPIPVPMDQEGIRPDLLSDAFGMTGARVLYCQPGCHNPTGTALSSERRHQIIDVVRAAGAFLVEDDFARFLGHGRPVPRPLIGDDRDGAVIYLTSLTKPASPSLRIAAVISRGPVSRRLRDMRAIDDFFTARPLQEAAVELLSSPSWERHRRALSAALRERCGVLAGALAAELPGWRLDRRPDAGLHLWVGLPPGLADTAVADAARAHGVVVDAGHRYFPDEPPAHYLRLSFAAAAEPADLREGVRRLARAARTLGQDVLEKRLTD
ncbi:PLP-dependent aminotransferase family protein [Nonomuraea sp. NPDC050783]|uniref:aminotransferase-like domain-containing protein n=1 Tax=Nonomuraea sp. NPDC050783 TaxID=3154634 RepID=UPI00346626B9